jgi:enamine deaminase RidA (YjgF/YER057c/UK114 family)
MKKLLILLPATQPGNALHAQLRKATHEEINFTDIKGIAKQFFAHNPYPAGSLPGVTKPADDHFRVEVEATALTLIVNL